MSKVPAREAQARELEARWEGGALVVRRPASAYRRRGVIAVTLSPLLLGFLVPLLLWFGETEDITLLLLLALCCVSLLGTMLAGVFMLSFASALSARTAWRLQRTQAPDGSVEVLLSGRKGAATHRLTSGSRAVAEANSLPGTYRLILYNAQRQQVCVLASHVNESFRRELDSAMVEVNRVLGSTPEYDAAHSAPPLASPVVPMPGASQGEATTPGERSLAMLCYLPVQGIFLLASIGCLVASKSQYARSAAKQSLLHFCFSLVVLGSVLVLIGVPTALLDDASPVKLVLAGVLAIALFAYLGWNIGAHVYACIRFYQGRPWVMPWLRPIARRWFE